MGQDYVPPGKKSLIKSSWLAMYRAVEIWAAKEFDITKHEGTWYPGVNGIEAKQIFDYFDGEFRRVVGAIVIGEGVFQAPPESADVISAQLAGLEALWSPYWTEPLPAPADLVRFWNTMRDVGAWLDQWAPEGVGPKAFVVSIGAITTTPLPPPAERKKKKKPAIGKAGMLLLLLIALVVTKKR